MTESKFSNTQLRIISAMVMVVLVVIGVMLGKFWMLGLCWFVGALCVDEALHQFSGLARNHKKYFITLLIYSMFFITMNFVEHFDLSRRMFLALGVLVHLALIFYLFKFPLKDKVIKTKSLEYPTIIAYLIMIPLFSFGVYFEGEMWKQNLALLLLVTFGMDTGAWFFGKNFGKHKLYPEVSPKKTVEGFIGGFIVSGILGTLFWWLFFNNFQWYYLIIFAFAGIISQAGDLVQSKIKREFEIKDSSNLIPGHGGVYDRIDSLIFLSPFFALIVKYLGSNLT